MIAIGTPHTRNSGYYQKTDPNNKNKEAEADIQTCPHCQAVIKMQEWSKATVQNFCIKCMKPACNHPACFECIPFIKKLEIFTDAVIKYERFLKMAGVDPVNPPPLIITGI